MALTSLVRFGSVDSINALLPRAADVSHFAVYIFLGTIEDRKVDVFERIFVGRNALPTSIFVDKLERGMIESTPEIVDNISASETDCDRDLSDFDKVNSALSSIHVFLGTNLIWFGIVETFNESIEITDVLFGPVYFSDC